MNKYAIFIGIFLTFTSCTKPDDGHCDLTQWPGVNKFSPMNKELTWIFENYRLESISSELEFSEEYSTQIIDGSSFDHPMPWICLLITRDGASKTTYVFFKTDL
jgi:hypothetical protein